MSQLWNEIREVDPNDSEAVKDVVNSFFQNASKFGDADSIKWLRTLGDIINRFPKYCMSHRITIESYLCRSIDSIDYYFVIEAAKCAQALQQVRPSQEKTATPKTSWQNQMNLLCSAGHTLISAVFPDAIDTYGEERNRNKNDSSSNSSLTNILLNISDMNNNQNGIENNSLLQIRLRNVFCYIQAMLVEVYPVAKPVRPQIVLNLIMRALSVSSGANNPHVDVLNIKIEALRTLDALVACLGPHLIPFSPLVFRLLMQTLRWSTENANKDSSKVRCTAYNSLGGWLNILHCHRSAADSRSCWEDELTKHILSDTAPEEKVVQLTMGPQPTKHMSKKAKRKLANSRLQESAIASHMPGEKNKVSKPEEKNDEVAMAALVCAETFLLVCGRFLKPITHQLLQERVLRECYNAHNYSEDMLILYLRVLEATRKTLPSGVPPPTQHCLQLYSLLVNTARGEISKFCTQSLLDIRLHLHCSPPSLNFALEAPQEKQSSSKKRKKVSQKNRAALESLLGPDRMSALDDQEDIITIPDEPSSKKLRLDEEADNISVSSESIDSVEISDDSDVEEVSVTVQNGDDDETVDGEKEVGFVNKETVAIDNEISSDLVDNAAVDVIEPMVLEKETVEKEISEKQADNKDSEDTVVNTDTIVHSTHVEENSKSVEIVVEQEKISIHDAPTQMPLNVSTDSIDGEEGPFSSEIAYDNSSQTTVTVLQKVDDEIFPCSNENDDVMITCGQLVKSSQEGELEKKSDDIDVVEAEVHEAPKMNGKLTENDINDNDDIPAENTKVDETNETKVVTKEGIVSVEDMLADFVDEVNEDITVT